MKLALFDLDYTLLAGDSDHAWGEFLVRAGLIDGADFGRRNDAFWAQYKAGILKIEEYLEFALSFIAGKSLEEVAPLHARYIEESVKPMIREPALELVRKHAGDLTCIVTATNEFLTAPAHDLFGGPRNQRGGCKLCKFWKVNGYQTERQDGERFSDHRRRVVADEAIAAALPHSPF